MSKILTYFSVVVLVIFLSCTKDESTNQDTFNTKINFTSPISDAEFTLGDTIVISAIITSDVSMHGYEILIHNKSQKTSYPLKSKHTHGKEISVNENWIVDYNGKTDVDIEIIAAIDHLDNKISSIRKVRCN
ncbi:MAG: hypothetical protein WAU01_12645 [Saprospiraceae bacterium]